MIMETLRRISYRGSLALLVYMPFHVFLSQWLSLYTGGLDVWKLAKDGVLAILTLFVICLVWVQRRSTKAFTWLVVVATLYLLLHVLLWLTHPDLFRDSAMLGIIYNNRLSCLVLLGFGTALLNPGAFTSSFLLKVMLAISTVVALLGVAQSFLPSDLLTHFGYGLERGTRAAFFIDDKAGFPRVMSTLREPNALGAFLIMPVTALAALFIRIKDQNGRMLLAGMLGLHGMALVMTFSRSAWLGAALGVGLVLWWSYREMVGVFVKRFGLVAGTLLLLVVAGLYAGRHSGFVTSYITHSSNQEQVADLDSNDYHREFIKRGLQGVIHKPFGHGSGTAGLASIQNPKGSFLTENYYVQIAYELGVVGFLLFVGLQVFVVMQLWRRRDNTLCLVLLASFGGYIVCNMLLHTWSNEAVATQWWLLAGLALGLPSASALKKQPATTKK
jgi:O-antigen ligase